MRELRTCDFCDGEAVGAFEIVPPELDPSEAEQRRVVLCRECKSLLGELLEPLLARATVGSTDGPAPNDSGSVEPSPGRSTEVGTEDEGDEDDGRRTGNGGSGVADENDGRGADDVGGGDPAVDSGTVTGSADPDGITITADGSSGPTGEDGPASGSGDGTDRAGGPANDGSPSAPSRSRPPRAYGKVLRLLRNREFPMARSDVEGLAAGAYDLEADEVEAVIEHAIEQGELVEDGRQLRRA